MADVTIQGGSSTAPITWGEANYDTVTLTDDPGSTTGYVIIDTANPATPTGFATGAWVISGIPTAQSGVDLLIDAGHSLYIGGSNPADDLFISGSASLDWSGAGLEFNLSAGGILTDPSLHVPLNMTGGTTDLSGVDNDVALSISGGTFTLGPSTGAAESGHIVSMTGGTVNIDATNYDFTTSNAPIQGGVLNIDQSGSHGSLVVDGGEVNLGAEASSLNLTLETGVAIEDGGSGGVAFDGGGTLVTEGAVTLPGETSAHGFTGAISSLDTGGQVDAAPPGSNYTYAGSSTTATSITLYYNSHLGQQATAKLNFNSTSGLVINNGVISYSPTDTLTQYATDWNQSSAWSLGAPPNSGDTVSVVLAAGHSTGDSPFGLTEAQTVSLGGLIMASGTEIDINHNSSITDTGEALSTMGGAGSTIDVYSASLTVGTPTDVEGTTTNFPVTASGTVNVYNGGAAPQSTYTLYGSQSTQIVNVNTVLANGPATYTESGHDNSNVVTVGSQGTFANSSSDDHDTIIVNSGGVYQDLAVHTLATKAEDANHDTITVNPGGAAYEQGAYNAFLVNLDGGAFVETGTGNSGSIDFDAGAGGTVSIAGLDNVNGTISGLTDSGSGAVYVDAPSGYTTDAKIHPTITSTSITLTFENSSGGTIHETVGFSSTTGLLVTDPTDPVTGDTNAYEITATVCFASGSRILTTRGEVAVEDLTVGELAVTASGEARPIGWIGHRKVERPSPAQWPVRVMAGAFGEGLPRHDLLLSPGHSVCVEVMGEVFVPVGQLVNGATIARVEAHEVTYWHVELESHDVLLAEGLPCESYMDAGNRAWFGRMYGRLAGIDPERAGENYARPFVDRGAIVEAIRERLTARAEAMGWTRAADMDLHLMVDGERVEPTIDGDLARFVFPSAATTARLVSHTLVAGGDPRTLGARIEGLNVSDGLRHSREVGLDEMAGLHPEEAAGGLPWRWTDGDLGLATTLWFGCRGVAILRLAFAADAAWRWIRPEERFAGRRNAA